MNEGFYKRRRGILEHIESHSIDLLESGIHDFLLLKCNLVIGSKFPVPAGVCLTSAPAVHAYCHRVSERTIQRCFQHLEEIDFIKTWKVPGKRGNFPVLLCRASVHDLSGNEFRINGRETTDWRAPIYEPVGDVSGKSRGTVGDVAGYREVRSKRRERTRAAKPAAPPNSRFHPTIDAYYQLQKKSGIEPNCDESDFASLKRWLRRNPNRTTESIVASLRNAISSTHQYPLRRGFRLREFLEHESKYQAGPILKAGQSRPTAVVGSEPKAPVRENRLSEAGAKRLEQFGLVGAGAAQ